MKLFSRRLFLKGLFGSAFSLVGGYAIAVEPGFRLRIQPYALTPPRWTPGLRLRIAVVADIHAGEPYMSLDRIERIVAATNALKADLIVLLGDYVAAPEVRVRVVPSKIGRAPCRALRPRSASMRSSATPIGGTTP
jgi:uncharacterized protein